VSRNKHFETYLAMAERHVVETECHLLHQRQVVAQLEQHGLGHSQTANVAKEILKSFEIVQKANIAHRHRLREALRAIGNAKQVSAKPPPLPALPPKHLDF